MRDKQIEGMAKAKYFEEIYKDLQETPTGAINEDFTLVTMSQQFNDSFIRSVAKHLMEKDYRKASDVAKEIFAELQQEIKLALDSNYKARMEHLNKYPDTDNEHLSMLSGKISALRGIDDFIDELKNKYESEGK